MILALQDSLSKDSRKELKARNNTFRKYFDSEEALNNFLRLPLKNDEERFMVLQAMMAEHIEGKTSSEMGDEKKV